MFLTQNKCIHVKFYEKNIGMSDFVLTTDSVDRYGGRILPNGVDFTAFNLNPVMLLEHWGSPIGKWENLRLSADGRRIIGTAVFDESDEKGAEIARKVADGFVNACSIGVRVLAWSEDEADMIAGQTWETVTKCELLECSIVAIPANSDAVVLTRSVSNNKTEQIKLEKGMKFEKGDILKFTYPIENKAVEPIGVVEKTTPPEPVETEEKAVPTPTPTPTPDFSTIINKAFEPITKSLAEMQGEIEVLKTLLNTRNKALSEQAVTISKQGDTIKAQGEKIKDLAKSVAGKVGKPIKQTDNGTVGIDNTIPPSIDQLANTKKHLAEFVSKGLMSKSEMDKQILDLQKSMGLN